MFKAAVGSALVLAALVSADVPKDKVTSLPGLKGEIPFPFYSGYLNVGGKYMVHYEFHGSKRSVQDPVVLWQQGGPGGSSIAVGALTEMGPFQTGDGSGNETTGIPKLFHNKYSWNNVANMVYFEHPPGVGFSYCLDASGSGMGPCPTWDDTTAAVVLADTIEAWFAAFNEFNGYDFHLSGESYSGIYVPSTAFELSKRSLKFNLRGLLVGNGCINVKGATEANRGNCNGPDRDMIFADMFYYHSLIPTETYDKIWSVCKFPEHGNWRNLPEGCQPELNAAQQQVYPINPYYVNDNCPMTPQSLLWSHVGRTADDLVTPRANLVNRFAHRAASPEEVAAVTKPIPQGGQPYRCGAESWAWKWLMNPAVKKALHMTGPIPNPNDFMYNPFGFSSIDHWPGLIDRYNTTIYNGVSDTICPWRQNEQWTLSLNYSVTSPWTPWTTLNGNAAYGKDYAGYHKAFTSPKGGSLQYVTVKDAGHMVPQYQPNRAFEMFKRFIAGQWNEQQQ